MNPNSISQIADTNANKSQTGKLLKNGSQVLVRVIEDKGNGKYEGSIAGVRSLFSAKNVLKSGASFVANVSLQNGKIIIVPKDKTGQFIQNKIDVISFLNENQSSENVFEKIENQTIANFISQFSLPPDKLSLHMILQFKQLDMKMDSGLLNKIRSMSLKFPGKEKKVSEFLSMFIKKGILLSEEEIEELLQQTDIDFDYSNKAFKQDYIDNTKVFFEKLIFEYLETVLNGVNQDKIGILTVLNQYYGKKSDENNKRWILFPFELVKYNNDEKHIEGKGIFKLFMANQNKLELINIKCNYREKSYIFLLKFDKNKLTNIKFSAGNEIDSKNLIVKLKNQFENQNIEIEWADKNIIDGSSCEDEKLFLFDGEI